MPSIVHRECHAKLRTRVQQSLALPIFAHRIHNSRIRKPVGNGLPRLPIIVGAVNIRRPVIHAMPLDSRVGCARAEVRGLDQRDPAPGLHPRRSHVGPALPPVARH